MVAVLAPHVGTLLLLESCFVPLWGNTQNVGTALEPAARCSCSTRAPLSLSARTYESYLPALALVMCVRVDCHEPTSDAARPEA